MDTPQGRIGFLFPEIKQKESRTKKGRKGGTDIHAGGTANLKYWFGQRNEEAKKRLCVFARTGAEGSLAAFWLNDRYEQQIVHMGSGSMLTCILADNATDFLRLIAIGYDEICWHHRFPFPPNKHPQYLVEPNVKFQEWIRETFRVSIPQKASEIVKHPANMHDEKSEDEFFNWYIRIFAKVPHLSDNFYFLYPANGNLFFFFLVVFFFQALWP